MNWIERVILAHKKNLDKRPPDRRGGLIALWEQYRNDGMSGPAAEMSLELATRGSRNEIELGFYVLMDLALSDESFRCHLSQLAKHKSATVRRHLAYYISKEFPSDFRTSVFKELLRDKAASVRISAIEKIGMWNWNAMLPDLCALRSCERSDKVIQSLNYWTPLLQDGYQVLPSQVAGQFLVTALTGRGISSKNVKASSPDDPRIRIAVEELRRFP